MLNRTLRFLSEKVAETLSMKSATVVLDLPDAASVKGDIVHKDHVALSLLNVSDDSFTRNSLINPFTTTHSPQPENAFFSLQLHVIFTAQSIDYAAGLSHIARIIGYFHLHPVLEMEFTTTDGIEKVQISMTLLSLNLEQSLQIRNLSGIAMQPFVCYKLRWNRKESNSHRLAYDD